MSTYATMVMSGPWALSVNLIDDGDAVRIDYHADVEPPKERPYTAQWYLTNDEWRQVQGGVAPAKLWTCEWQVKTIAWVEPFWPLYCPICGKAVHDVLSAHHDLHDYGTEPVWKRQEAEDGT